jgi:mono-ADP-ribosyltransferase sirtuin 6
MLRDTILDWEDELPKKELNQATKFCLGSDLVLCLGTTLQINPAAELPFLCQKGRPNPRKVVIINLQKTKHDDRADLILHDYVDNVMMAICKALDVQVPEYDPAYDLTLFEPKGALIEWKN